MLIRSKPCPSPGTQLRITRYLPPRAPVEIVEAQLYPSFATGPSLRKRTTREPIRHHHGAFLHWEVSEALRLECMLALFPDILPSPPVGVSYLPSMCTEGSCPHAVFCKVMIRLPPPDSELVLLQKLTFLPLNAVFYMEVL